MSYAEYLKSYFDKNRKKLTINYPGLNLHRLNKEAPVSDLNDLYLEANEHPFKIFIEKLNLGIPLEYISGRTYFYRSSFFVNENVLIPRSETEILVELAVDECKKNYHNKHCKVLDVCTGSGIIGLSLLREGGAEFELTLSDLSKEALEIAKINYFEMEFLFNPNHKINFCESDRLAKIDGTFDLILSNPPYIKSIADKMDVHEQVIKFEPHLALFLEDNVYEKWFQDFLNEIFSHLKIGGLSILEGHENHLEILKKIANTIGFKNIDIIKDYNQRDRFLRLIK